VYGASRIYPFDCACVARGGGKICIKDLYIKLFSAVRYAREGRDTPDGQTARPPRVNRLIPTVKPRRRFFKNASALWLSIFGR